MAELSDEDIIAISKAPLGPRIGHLQESLRLFASLNRDTLVEDDARQEQESSQDGPSFYLSMNLY